MLPRIDNLENWLKQQNVLKNKLGAAIDYALEQMPGLRCYLDDERIGLSNNCAERCVKPFTIGRKNWLFANTPDGPTASGAFYSIISTAKANGVDPYRYLVWLFTEFPKCQIRTQHASTHFSPGMHRRKREAGPHQDQGRHHKSKAILRNPADRLLPFSLRDLFARLPLPSDSRSRISFPQTADSLMVLFNLFPFRTASQFADLDSDYQIAACHGTPALGLNSSAPGPEHRYGMK